MESKEFNARVAELIGKLRQTKTAKDQLEKEYAINLRPEVQENLRRLEEIIKEIERQLSFI